MTMENLQLFGKRDVLSVGQLTRLIKSQLEGGFRDFWVEGELSNLKQPASGHLYFTLKDPESQVRTVLFRSMSRFLKFKPKDGMSVLCRGRLSVYEPRGEYQIIVEYMEPKGIGALQLAFEELKEILSKEGLFDPKHKKPIPTFPKTIGVVTSPSGAAIRDIVNILFRRRGSVHIVLLPVQVQGEGAAKEIVDALDVFNERGDIDVIILGRGGGSLEDLWAFNEEVVARAVSRSKIPVISAVGHETDFTISDFVSDLRAPTPSAAAELVSHSQQEWFDRFQSYLVKLKHGIQVKLEGKKRNWEVLIKGLPSPQVRIDNYLQRLDELEARLRLNFSHRFQTHRRNFLILEQGLRYLNPVDNIGRSQESVIQYALKITGQIQTFLVLKKRNVEKLMKSLDALSPLSVLERGYSITWRLPGMKVVRDAGCVRPGDHVKIKLFRGELMCRTEETVPGKNPDPHPPMESEP